MVRTSTLRRQHQEIQSVIDSVKGILDCGEVADQAQRLRQLISSLSGKLGVHLAMEDKVLYPEIQANGNHQLQAIGTEYQREMGELQDLFTNYSHKWTQTKITSNPEAFAKETQVIFFNITQRISREDEKLYPIVDGLS